MAGDVGDLALRHGRRRRPRSAAEQLRKVADEISGFFQLAQASWAAGRTGKTDLN